jgi:hypothetical protein
MNVCHIYVAHESLVWSLHLSVLICTSLHSFVLPDVRPNLRTSYADWVFVSNYEPLASNDWRGKDEDSLAAKCRKGRTQ